MTRCWVAPFSYIVAMDVFLPTIIISWELDVDEEPNVFPPLRLYPSFWEWLSERGGVVPYVTSNLDSACVRVVSSNLGDCGSTFNDFEDSCFFCVPVTTHFASTLALTTFCGRGKSNFGGFNHIKKTILVFTQQHPAILQTTSTQRKPHGDRTWTIQ